MTRDFSYSEYTDSELADLAEEREHFIEVAYEACKYDRMHDLQDDLAQIRSVQDKRGGRSIADGSGL